ncbi:hypothetical protein GCM10020256_37020 [Streptomyces thermocoprophilus]
MDHPRAVRALGERLQPGEQLAGGGADDHRAMVERGPCGQGHRHVHRVGAGQRRVQPGGLPGEGVRTARGHRPGDGGQRPYVGRDGLLGLRGLFEDDVGVGAADAEGGDGGAAGAAGVGPFLGRGEGAYAASVPVDVRGGLVEVEGGGQEAVAHGQDHLDDAGDTGGGLGVADVGLQRAQPQRAVGVVLGAVGGEQRLRLDRVTQRRTRAVGLDGVDGVGG